MVMVVMVMAVMVMAVTVMAVTVMAVTVMVVMVMVVMVMVIMIIMVTVMLIMTVMATRATGMDTVTIITIIGMATVTIITIIGMATVTADGGTVTGTVMASAHAGSGSNLMVTFGTATERRKSGLCEAWERTAARPPSVRLAACARRRSNSVPGLSFLPIEVTSSVCPSKSRRVFAHPSHVECHCPRCRVTRSPMEPVGLTLT